MELIHTSPSVISKITKTGGLFDEFLCFSGKEYVMTASNHVAYKIKIDKSEIIDASQIFYDEKAELLRDTVDHFCSIFDVDSDTAQEIISEQQQLETDDVEDTWTVQLFTARCAKILGYRGVRGRDEQGAVYMIDMLGKENDLVLQ